jgi:hypothetical protein
MKGKRLTISIVTGSILGIFCIIGLIIRKGFAGNELFILSTWVNRVVMGLVIGLLPQINLKNNKTKIFFRGALFGLIIGGAFYLATSFKDTPGFIAAIVYGIIIDHTATRYGN